jgi:2,3-bisphosphoglycerate-independent phosphoglycerate mutase
MSPKKFAGRLLLNIVLDGYGLGKKDKTNAIFQAKTPFMDSLLRRYAHTSLATHGHYVGLPGKNDLGGSEVGHLTMGAGEIIQQGPSIITKAIGDGSFFQRSALVEALTKAEDGALHLLGLLSDGNVHSHISHLIAVIEEAARRGVKKCYLHALLDGRDVGIQTANIYVEKIEALLNRLKQENRELDYRFVSAGGREVITMDRDKNWSKIERGWHTHINGESGSYFDSIEEGISYFRKRNSELIDQDCPPFNIKGKGGDVPQVKDGDVMIFMNFRADRAIEFTEALTNPDFSGFARGRVPDVHFVSMLVYDEDRNLPKNRIMGSPVVKLPFGRRLDSYGLTQFRLAETQKYAHVTFFYNGGYREPLNKEKEHYYLIESDKIDSFAQAPAMKALEIATKAVELVRSGRFDFGLINFANADMVGHTGDMEATIKAIEVVDQALKTICTAIREVNGLALITADHGNADEMLIFNKKKNKMERSTKHSTNLVPCVLYDPAYLGEYKFKEMDGDLFPGLAMIAATNHLLLGRDIPAELEPPLFED